MHDVNSNHSAHQFKHRLEVTEAKRNLLWRLLREGGSKATWDQTNAVLSGIKTAIENYNLEVAEDQTRRAAQEDLREIFMACADRRNHAKIRRKVLRLPILAREEVLRRARARYPELNGGGELAWERFREWAQTCEANDLVAKLQGVIASGRTLSLGQVRRTGRPSAPHVEPMIMGGFQRLKPLGNTSPSGHTSNTGGHPRDDAADALARDLALLWVKATGDLPRSSRSKKTPFGRLTHLVLRCAGVRSPSNALRRFWASVKHHRERPSNIPPA